MAEGYPTRLRVHLPSFLAYTPNDAFATNYSLSDNPDPVAVEVAQTTPDEFGNHMQIVDFVFLGGVTYADIISFNLTLTVDPTGTRPPGSGQADGALALSPVCHQNVIDGFPADPAENFRQCGEAFSIPISMFVDGACLYNLNYFGKY